MAQNDKMPAKETTTITDRSAYSSGKSRVTFYDKLMAVLKRCQEELVVFNADTPRLYANSAEYN